MRPVRVQKRLISRHVSYQSARLRNTPVARATQRTSLRDLHPMRFIIEFGEKEKHRMKYDFNQLFGRLVIMADVRPVKTAYRLVNEPELEAHVSRVGRFEKSLVRIEKQRKQLLGHRNRVFVNDCLVRRLTTTSTRTAAAPPRRPRFIPRPGTSCGTRTLSAYTAMDLVGIAGSALYPSRQSPVGW